MNEPVRVLHAVSKMDRGGIENFIMNVYREIDKTKIQFDFLDHTQEEGAFDKEIISLGGKRYKLKKFSSNYFLQYGHDLKNFFLSHHEYSIIHSHLNLLSAFTLKGAEKAGIAVRIAHSHTNMLLNRGIKKAVKLYAKLIINKYATCRFACSKEAAVWQFGKYAAQAKIVPNGIDLEAFKFSAETRRKIRNGLGISDEAIVFAHSGGFRQVKNHSFLIDIFEQIKKREPATVLILAGGGSLQPQIEEKVKQAGLTSSVIFTGSIQNVRQYFCAADAFIFPSIYEGLGISVIEAQAVGLPCFVSDGVPAEAKVSKKYFPLPLKMGAKVWADFILQTLPPFLKNPDRELSASAEKYNIKIVAKKLENFYLNGVFE